MAGELPPNLSEESSARPPANQCVPAYTAALGRGSSSSRGIARGAIPVAVMAVVATDAQHQTALDDITAKDPEMKKVCGGG